MGTFIVEQKLKFDLFVARCERVPMAAVEDLAQGAWWD